MQAVREIVAVLSSQRGDGEQLHGAFSPQVAGHAQAGAGRHGAVRQHQVQLVQGQVGQQGLEFIFQADELDGLVQAAGGVEHAVGHQFWQGIGNAHRQAHLFRIRVGQRFLHLFAQQENLVRVAERQPARFRRHQAPPLRLQQGPAQLLFQQGQLGADGLHGQAQALGRARHAAFLGDHPKEVQMAVIETGSFHRVGLSSVFTK